MNIKGLIITTHALNQFKNRSEALGHKLEKPLGRLTHLLTTAKHDNISLYSFLNRKKRHNNEDADYYQADGWRFVVVTDRTGLRKLVTVERREYRENKNTCKGANT
jgi:hypothetical protein